MLDAYFSGTKIAWLLDNVPGRARARASAASSPSAPSTPGSLWKLTGGARPRDRREQRLAHAALQHPRRSTGTTSCSRSWTSRARCCREVAPSSGIVGEHRAARACPAASRSPASPGDQQAALFGQACFAPGHGEEHLRHRLLPADEHRRAPAASHNRLLTTVAWQPRRARRPTRSRAASSSPGAAIQWLRDGLGLIARAAEIEALAASRARHRRRATSCRRSSGSARRTGTRTRAARSSGSRAARRARTSRAPRSRRSPSRARS